MIRVKVNGSYSFIKCLLCINSGPIGNTFYNAISSLPSETSLLYFHLQIQAFMEPSSMPAALEWMNERIPQWMNECLSPWMSGETEAPGTGALNHTVSGGLYG